MNDELILQLLNIKPKISREKIAAVVCPNYTRQNLDQYIKANFECNIEWKKKQKTKGDQNERTNCLTE